MQILIFIYVHFFIIFSFRALEPKGLVDLCSFEMMNAQPPPQKWGIFVALLKKTVCCYQSTNVIVV
jgi:hypothetical protein